MAEPLLVKVLNSTVEKRTYPVMERSIAAITKFENFALGDNSYSSDERS
jgi:hypothetical protein